MKLKKVLPIIAMLLVVLMAGCNKKDDLTGPRPKVISTDPISEATDIAISSNISAIFSMAMTASTITVTTFTVKQGTTAVTGAIGYTGKTATFNPAANLSTSTLYTATIIRGCSGRLRFGPVKRLYLGFHHRRTSGSSQTNSDFN